ncbi:FUSC family protein [Pararobbsia silviterrae]|uniref:AraE protein n=1 Tax=Pararobbsia silviterrae TaxID=1792498 RepID=A0A494XKK2_9BURK|nr:FUSC family membrane protein [Pararobbsia silviterrae]RKP50272.1 AraE protein [Pararobbsia silviterrae]
MRYSTEIRKFLYSQYFYGGLRIAFGVSFPVILCVLVLHDTDLGFTISAGALAACAVDMPGPIKYKHNEMLSCAVLGFASALVTGLVTPWPVALFVTVVALSFTLSLTVVYGFRWPQIGFATLFMMILTMDERFTVVEAFENAGWILAGGLWYTYWSTALSTLLRDRIEQQAIADNLFALAEYVRARAAFYDPQRDLDECYRNLVLRQIPTVDKQDAARDIALRNLPKLENGQLDARRTVLFNLFINTVDLHEGVLAAHTDYPLVRSTFGDADLMLFFRDLLDKLADDLEHVGLAVLRDTPVDERTHTKAEFRAIEYEIEQLRKKHYPAQHPEAYSAVVASYRRIWSAARVLDKMRANTHRDIAVQKPEMPIDKALDRFLVTRRVQWRLLLSNLTMASPSFRHALRVAIAVALGFWLGKILPLTHSYWICMTTIIILKPGFSMTRQRNAQRIIGTAIGCAASVALVLSIHNRDIELAIMAACMVMSYSLTIFNYTASVAFTSAFVLILYHLLAPASMRLIGERAIDTAVGCALAIGSSYLFPYWEYRLMRPAVNEVIASMRRYLDAVWPRGAEAAGAANAGASAPSSASSSSASASGLAAAQVAPAAPLMQRGKLGEQLGARAGSRSPTRAADAVIDADFTRRLARKNMHVAFANLGNAFQRMMLEPKSQQRFVAELNDLLVQSHTLGSQMAAATPLFVAPPAPEADLPKLDAALGDVRANLVHAEQGDLSAQTGDPRERSRVLDTLVVALEKDPSTSPETIQDLKLLVHQTKQMIAVSERIRKDAAAIRLPA